MAISDSPFLPSLAGRVTLPNNPRSIRRYQAFHKLPVTGMIDARTAKFMRQNNTRIASQPMRYS
jgi:peptidoglycan hydrolase-like protein with peptidoglycan-binding domain